MRLKNWPSLSSLCTLAIAVVAAAISFVVRVVELAFPPELAEGNFTDIGSSRTAFVPGQRQRVRSYRDRISARTSMRRAFSGLGAARLGGPAFV